MESKFFKNILWDTSICNQIVNLTDKISRQQYLFLVSTLSCVIIFLKLVATNQNGRNGSCQIRFLKRGAYVRGREKIFGNR